MDTIWQTQVVLDDKNILQPTSAFASRGDEPAINFMSDVMSLGKFFGFDAAHFGGIYFNTESNTNTAYNPLPPNGRSGATTQIMPSQQTNAGLHGREEITSKSVTSSTTPTSLQQITSPTRSAEGCRTRQACWRREAERTAARSSPGSRASSSVASE